MQIDMVAADAALPIDSVPMAGSLLIVGTLIALLIASRVRTRLRRRALPEAADTTIPLAVRGITKRYGNLIAVDDATLVVRPGRILALIGPNGAGKSTLLRMLVGLVEPDEGTVVAFGHPVEAGAPVLSRIGVTIEAPGYAPHLTGRANLEILWAMSGRPTSDAHMETVEQLSGLGSALDVRTSTYSQGMLQRLALAGAMLGLPELLILDEPTNGLDPGQMNSLRDTLQRYASSGRAVVVSSHHLAEVERICTDVVLMMGGRVQTCSTVEELRSKTATIDVVVSDPAAALAALEGVSARTTGKDCITIVLEATTVDETISRLSHAGIATRNVQSRGTLEQLYFEVVGRE